MSQENIDAFKRGDDAANRRDIEALLAELDPGVEWHGAIAAALLGGQATVYRGHEGVREWLRDQEEAFAETQTDYSEIRDLGERVLAIGRLRTRGNESGAETESPVALAARLGDNPTTVLSTYAHLLPQSHELAAERVAAVLEE